MTIHRHDNAGRPISTGLGFLPFDPFLFPMRPECWTCTYRLAGMLLPIPVSRSVCIACVAIKERRRRKEQDAKGKNVEGPETR